MNIALITGAAGLIGSESVAFFANKFDLIIGIDNNLRQYFFGQEASTEWNKNRIEEQFANYKHQNIDIRDYGKLGKLFKKYGSDIKLGDTPFHVMGLERLVEEQPQDYIGKAALESLRKSGVDRKLVGVELEGEELRAEMSEYWSVVQDGKKIGHLTDAVWSPGLKKNIGYVWVPIELAAPGTKLDIETDDGTRSGVTAAVPFIDPQKKVPAA